MYNHLASGNGHNSIAFSRGFEVFKGRNKGPISIYAKDYLNKLAIPFEESRVPLQISEIDFLIAHKVVLMDRTEHEPMLEKYHPEIEDHVEFWNFQDIQFMSSEKVLPALERKIRGIFSSTS